MGTVVDILMVIGAIVGQWSSYSTCDFSVVACLPQLLLLPLLLPRLLLLSLDIRLTLHASMRLLLCSLHWLLAMLVKVKIRTRCQMYQSVTLDDHFCGTLAAFLALIRSARLPCCPGTARPSKFSFPPCASDRLAATNCRISAWRDFIDWPVYAWTDIKDWPFQLSIYKLVLSLALDSDLAEPWL